MRESDWLATFCLATHSFSSRAIASTRKSAIFVAVRGPRPPLEDGTGVSEYPLHVRLGLLLSGQVEQGGQMSVHLAHPRCRSCCCWDSMISPSSKMKIHPADMPLKAFSMNQLMTTWSRKRGGGGRPEWPRYRTSAVTPILDRYNAGSP